MIENNYRNNLWNLGVDKNPSSVPGYTPLLPNQARDLLAFAANIYLRHTAARRSSP